METKPHPILGLCIILVIAYGISRLPKPVQPAQAEVTDVQTPGPYDDFQTFWLALTWKESKHDPNAKGDKRIVDGYPVYRAWGIAQIWCIYLDDANEWRRKHGQSEFSREDRLDPDKSMLIAIAYLERWGSNFLRKTGRHPTWHDLARIHNGGPDGWKQTSTIGYADDVILYMQEKPWEKP